MNLNTISPVLGKFSFREMDRLGSSLHPDLTEEELRLLSVIQTHFLDGAPYVERNVAGGKLKKLIILRLDEIKRRLWKYKTTNDTYTLNEKFAKKAMYLLERLLEEQSLFKKYPFLIYDDDVLSLVDAISDEDADSAPHLIISIPDFIEGLSSSFANNGTPLYGDALEEHLELVRRMFWISYRDNGYNYRPTYKYGEYKDENRLLQHVEHACAVKIPRGYEIGANFSPEWPTIRCVFSGWVKNQMSPGIYDDDLTPSVLELLADSKALDADTPENFRLALSREDHTPRELARLHEMISVETLIAEADPREKNALRDLAVVLRRFFLTTPLNSLYDLFGQYVFGQHGSNRIMSFQHVEMEHSQRILHFILNTMSPAERFRSCDDFVRMLSLKNWPDYSEETMPLHVETIKFLTQVLIFINLAGFNKSSPNTFFLTKTVEFLKKEEPSDKGFDNLPKEAPSLFILFNIWPKNGRRVIAALQRVSNNREMIPRGWEETGFVEPLFLLIEHGLRCSGGLEDEKSSNWFDFVKSLSWTVCKEALWEKHPGLSLERSFKASPAATANLLDVGGNLSTNSNAHAYLLTQLIKFIFDLVRDEHERGSGSSDPSDGNIHLPYPRSRFLQPATMAECIEA